MSISGNNTAIREVFLRLSHQFTQMYSRKAYVHFYTQEGMDIFEFDEAKTDVENLMNDYQLCQQTRSEDHMELRTKKR